MLEQFTGKFWIIRKHPLLWGQLLLAGAGGVLDEWSSIWAGWIWAAVAAIGLIGFLVCYWPMLMKYAVRASGLVSRPVLAGAIIVISCIIPLIIVLTWPQDDLLPEEEALLAEVGPEAMLATSESYPFPPMYDDPELRTRPLCHNPSNAPPYQEVDCTRLNEVVEYCGLISVRAYGITRIDSADPRGAVWHFRGCLRGQDMDWETCGKGEKDCYLFEFTGEKGYQSMRDFEGK